MPAPPFDAAEPCCVLPERSQGKANQPVRDPQPNSTPVIRSDQGFPGRSRTVSRTRAMMDALRLLFMPGYSLRRGGNGTDCVPDLTYLARQQGHAI
jgi:hypothetical protein